MVAFAGQSFQPKSVGQQQMIQRSVEAAEVEFEGDTTGLIGQAPPRKVAR